MYAYSFVSTTLMVSFTYSYYLTTILTWFFNIISASIHDNIKYFETIHADQVKHTIVKRGLKESNHPYNKIKEINFSALGQDFRVILTPKRGVLHPKFKAYSVDGDGKETTIHLGNN